MVQRSVFEEALYTDESGVVVGLDEVQLLEDPPAERIATLRKALRVDDLEIQYRAALVLTAWGNDEGLATIEEFIDNRIDKLGIWVPHRIYGYNNLYDEFAYAVSLYGGSRRHVEDQKRIYGKLLSLYGPCDFAFKLKYALLQTDYQELASNVELACLRSLKLGKEYLASQLLPVLARWNQAVAHRLLPTFIHEGVTTPNPTANVVESLRYMDPNGAVTTLQMLAEHPDSVVANEAKQAIADAKS